MADVTTIPFVSPPKDFWVDRRVAITGGTGFIGQHVVALLAKRGARVTALTRASSDVRRLKDLGVECRVAPLEDVGAMIQALQGCEYLFHIAACVSFGDDLPRLRQINVEGTRRILHAASASNVSRIIYTSSVAAIGATSHPVIMNEQTPWTLRCDVPYVTTKKEAEELVLQRSTEGMDIVVVNPTCVLGPNDFAGSEFGLLCKRFWRGRIPFHFGGGQNFVDVRDVAAGHLLAAEHGRSSQRYILGGENLSFSQFFRLLNQVAFKKQWWIRLPQCLRGPIARLTQDFFDQKKQHPRLNRVQARLVGSYSFVTFAKAVEELGYTTRKLLDTLNDTYEFWITPRLAA
jgi:dihydroflavonol-4-reductase